MVKQFCFYLWYMSTDDLIWPEFELTDEMINQIRNEIIPNLKAWYNISSKDDYLVANEDGEIDNVDLFQYIDGHFAADEILKIKRTDFPTEDDYLEEREKRWEETFEISEEQHIINLGTDYLEENEW